MKRETHHLRYILYTVAAVAVCIAPFALMSVDATTEPIGNETPSVWPSLRDKDGKLNTDFLSEAGDYIEDRVALRPEMITADSLLKDRIFDTSSQDSVIAGTDGWLYYAATLDDYQHQNNVSDRMLFNEAWNVRLMQDYVESLGETFIFTIAPNKNTLYGKHMPARYQVQVAAESDFQRLVPYLEEAGVHYVDLDALFRAQPETLYYARDSHWNQKGAVLVYNALLDAAEQPHEDYSDVQPAVTEDYYGDLGKMLYPAGAEPEEELHYLQNPTWQYMTDTSSVEENYIQTENEDGEGSLLLYRDSFGNSLLPYMAQAYGQATFSKLVPYDLSTDAQTADTVIVERVERHLPTLAQVAPVIPAPMQDYVIDFGDGGTDPDTGENTGSTLQISASADGQYYILTGQVDPALAEASGEDTSEEDATAEDQDDTGDAGTAESLANVQDNGGIGVRIYAQITDDSSEALYEASLLSTADYDYGFQLYIPAAQVDGSILNTKILVQNGEEYTLALEE